MYILGINSAYHESAACVLVDGKLIAAVEEERFNRIKHTKPAKVDNSNQLPWDAINYCLKEAGITLKDVEYLGYSLNPRERLEKNTAHVHPYQVTPGDFGTKEGEELFYQKNLEVEGLLRNAGFEGKFHFLGHHDCHAASAFFVSPFDKAGILVIDGIGEFESTTIYSGQGNKIEKKFCMDYSNSLGFLWEKISTFLGFDGYDAAKVMGLSTYGDPVRYRKEFKMLVKTGEKFETNDALLRFRTDDHSALEELFRLKKRNEPIKGIDLDTKDYADVAATLQEVTEEIIFALASKTRRLGGDRLCMAGGVALNCLANGKLIQQQLFEDIFIQPAANDAGTAIGGAFFIWNQILGKPRNYVFESPYLGPAFDDDEIKQVLDKNSLKYSIEKFIEQGTAKLIAEGNIVAWFQGKLEIGPRALGNRSILADPRKRESVSELNAKVKFREPFRPLCPSVLEEEFDKLFVVGDRLFSPAKYMLATYNVIPEKRSTIPAVVHIDGTSRIQLVSKKTNPRYHKLITEFYKLTGVPIVLNTSFNSREPIVCSPADAVKTFLSTKIDYLAIGDFLVSKEENRNKRNLEIK
ncbi:MAG: carbamoyltransferase C-terminal domain-containing protein [Candidatus Micrarchaeota archaeon]